MVVPDARGARDDHWRWNERDPAQYHWRARTGPAEGIEESRATEAERAARPFTGVPLAPLRRSAAGGAQAHRMRVCTTGCRESVAALAACRAAGVNLLFARVELRAAGGEQCIRSTT